MDETTLSISNEKDFIVDDPLAECRHNPAAFTTLEIFLMIFFQFFLFLLYFFGITYLWMLKVRAKAEYYLNALPNKKILQYMKKEQKAPFELQPL
uniref:ATP synthase F0 subunit 8 n=1 Tax=Panagrolaimus sp. ES5 TaxID=591445 RepID=A0AC34FF53_9BILA